MDRLLAVQNDLIAGPVEEQELWKFLDMLVRETLLDIDCIHRTVYPRFKIIYKILNNAKKKEPSLSQHVRAGVHVSPAEYVTIPSIFGC